MKKVTKVFLLLILPIIFSLYLYPLHEEVVFDGKNYQQHDFIIEDLFKKEPTIRNLLADIFSVPLFLDWYYVNIKNNSHEENSNCLQGDPPILFLEFREGDPRRYSTNLKETTKETGFYNIEIGPGHPVYYLPGKENAYFLAPSWEVFSINGGILSSGECHLGMPNLMWEFQFTELIFDYNISIKPHLASWFAKVAIIYLLWIFLISSLVTIAAWIR